MPVFFTILVEHLIWSDANIAHIARHQINPSEVEEVCFGEHMATDSYGGRVLVIGSTQDGKVLTIILHEKEERVFFPVTARPASRKERKLYEAYQTKEVA